MVIDQPLKKEDKAYPIDISIDQIRSLINNRDKKITWKRNYNKRAPQPDVTLSTLVDLVDMTE